MTQAQDTPDTIDGPAGRALWQRHDAVIPGGGVYFTRSARFAGRDVLPGFVAHAQGARIRDADGREYLDFNCGNGPNLLGYRHPEVEAAAAAQAAEMDLAAFFPAIMPAYAEALLAHFTDFDWVVFAKNGSDATTLALRVMRQHTLRPRVILFESAYHGFGTELALTPDPAPRNATAEVLRLPWNDIRALASAEQRFGAEIAGVLVNPLDQSPARPTSALSPDMVEALHRLRVRTGALIALDDVRHGFRLHPAGSHHASGLAPDLTCLGKALANGHATAALLGTVTLREAIERIPFTATYMFSAVAFAAGLKTLEVYRRDDVFRHLQRQGRRLVDGLLDAARQRGHEDLVMSGPATMPTLLFEGDDRQRKARAFARLAAERGAILHPRLNWFLCAAHGDAEIDAAIAIADDALAGL